MTELVVHAYGIRKQMYVACLQLLHYMQNLSFLGLEKVILCSLTGVGGRLSNQGFLSKLCF